MHLWRVIVALACCAVCFCQNATESSASASIPANATVSPPAATGSTATDVTTSNATGAEGSTSADHATSAAATATTAPSDDVTATESTTAGADGAVTTSAAVAEGSPALEASTTAGQEPETTVAPLSAAATGGSTASAAETTTEPVASTSAVTHTDAATSTAPSITDAATTAATPAATSATTMVETTKVPSPETTQTQPAGAVETAVTTETAETVETSETSEPPSPASSQPESTATPPTLTPTARSSETPPTVTSSTGPPTSVSPPPHSAEETATTETSSSEADTGRLTTPAAPSPASSTTEVADKDDVHPTEYYGYPRSMTEQEMGIDEVEGAVTVAVTPRRIGFLAWLALKERLLRSAILNITRGNGFNSSELEWVYISPSPTHRPPHVLLSFLIVWRGGGPLVAAGTVTPAVTGPASTAASWSDSGEPSTSAAAAASAAPTSAAAASLALTSLTSAPPTAGSRRRRAVDTEQESGVVPASLLKTLIEDNSDQLGQMMSASLESVSAGLVAPLASCSQEDGFMAANGQIMVALSVAAAICICLMCAALVYVRLIRDSGHWDPQPACHEGERLGGGVDLHSDADCKKGEEPPDGNGAEVYPLSSVPNTPRGSMRRGDDRV